MELKFFLKVFKLNKLIRDLYIFVILVLILVFFFKVCLIVLLVVCRKIEKIFFIIF